MAHVLVKNYTEQGGEKTHIGGTLDVESGGALDVKSGGAIKIAGTALTKTAAQLNAAAAHIADQKTDYTTGDLDIEAEIIAAFNATNTAINAALAALEAAGIVATE